MSAATAAARRAGGRPRLSARLIAIIGVVLVLGGGAAAGTLAAFTATTTNASSVSTGALVLSNTKLSGSACVSAVGVTDVNANPDCDVLLTVDTTRPGDAATTAAVILENVGNIGATSFQTYASSACTTDNAPSASFHGLDDLCPLVQLTIQSYTSLANVTNDVPAGGTCVYGIDTSPADGVCDGYSSSRNLAHFAATYPSFALPLAFGALAADEQRFYRIGVRLDPAAGNGIQGRRATFGFTWRLVQ